MKKETFKILDLMNEIDAREENPNKLIWCPYCKTKTASCDGECYFKDEHEGVKP